MNSGEIFGRLMLIARSSVNHKTYWLCKCVCGVEKVIRQDAIKSGSTVSCGCFSLDQTLARQTKHGCTKRPGYLSWSAMIDRCYDKQHQSYKYYGGRGISVCERWMSPDAFLNDMGEPKEGMQIDRINSDGNYEPGNCRWVDRSTNINNRRNTKWIEVNGVKRTVSEWASIGGISITKIHVRLFRGWSPERAIQPTNFKLKENRNA